MPGNRDDCNAWEVSGAKAAVGKTMLIGDGGYRGTGLVIPHSPTGKRNNGSHRIVRAHFEHAFARMKT